jgi:hypothetical protein
MRLREMSKLNELDAHRKLLTVSLQLLTSPNNSDTVEAIARILDLRHKIWYTKNALRHWGLRVDDFPDDLEPERPSQGAEEFTDHSLLTLFNTAPEPTHSPPTFATRLLRHLPISSDAREAVEGDLEEEHRAIYDKAGRWKADAWFCRQVIVSYWPFLIAKARRLVEQVRQRLG